VLGALRARERVARELGDVGVWDERVEQALRQQAQQQRQPEEQQQQQQQGRGVQLSTTTEAAMETGLAEVEAAEAFGVDLVQPFEFDWVDHSFTNFCGADSFIGRLDYILPDRRSLRVASVAPMPGLEEAAMATGWPCAGHPSDHVSLLYDLVPAAVERKDLT
jgi:mRNA deadenylase 3'-5' endonuclease subunit Ccr4